MVPTAPVAPTNDTRLNTFYDLPSIVVESQIRRLSLRESSVDAREDQPFSRPLGIHNGLSSLRYFRGAKGDYESFLTLEPLPSGCDRLIDILIGKGR